MKSTKMMALHVAVAALLPVLGAAPAQAGFEWTPPPAAPAVAASSTDDMPPVPAVPAGMVETMDLMPIPGASENAPVVSPAAIARESATLPTPSPEILAAPAATGPYAHVQGFGADIPLALALGQVVPPEFAYSFATGVNPGLKVSWDGGKPWNEVLNNALAPHDLRADVAGSAVVVRQGKQAARAARHAAAPETATIRASQNDTAYNTVPRAPADMIPPGMPGKAAVTSQVTGEGSANYPRRTSPRPGIFGDIFGGIFVPDSSKVAVRNDAPPEDIDFFAAEGASRPVPLETGVSKAVAPKVIAPKVIADVEPSAPAVMTPFLTRASNPSAAQQISYADEETRPHADFQPARLSAQAKSGVLDPFQVSFWQADNNANLRDVLAVWAAQAGVEVIWDSGHEYKLPASVSLHGTFPEAVARVFDLYGTTEPRPQGRLHPNLPQGPSVLLIENFP